MRLGVNYCWHMQFVITVRWKRRRPSPAAALDGYCRYGWLARACARALTRSCWLARACARALARSCWLARACVHPQAVHSVGSRSESRLSLSLPSPSWWSIPGERGSQEILGLGVVIRCIERRVAKHREFKWKSNDGLLLFSRSKT